MPGKYSYGVVLAQYSSQGIISLPNDGYFGSAAPPRAASAIALRNRTTSSATHSTGQHSLTSRSLASIGQIARSRTKFLPPSTNTPGNQERVVIVPSDSESEGDVEFRSEDEEEWVRPHPLRPHGQQVATAKSCPGPLATVSPRLEPIDAQNQSIIPEVDRTPMTPTKTPDPQMALIPSERPRRRGGGVRALIQARHKAEMKIAANADETEESDDAGLSLREFLGTTKKSGKGKERQMTVRQFLETVPPPSAIVAPTQTDSEVVTTPPLQFNDKMTTKSEPEQSNGGSAYQRQNRKASEYPKSVPLVLGEGFKYHENQVNNAKALTPQAARQSPINPQSEKFSRPRDQISFEIQPPESSKATYSSLELQVNKGFRPAGVQLSQQRSPPRLAPRANKSGKSHRRAKSSLTTLDSSQSSIFGLSSIETATEATSGQSPSSRKMIPAERSTDRDLSLFEQDQKQDALTTMFNDINNTTTMFPSEDEEDDQEEVDMRTPRLQSIPESDLSSGAQWGAISTGHNTTDRPRDADEMSEMSAVFPPDIGRYRYDEDESFMGVHHPEPLKSFRTKQKKTGSEVGLLQKLKKKALR